MSTNYTSDNQCPLDDHLCIAREYNQAVIIVPTMLLLASLLTLMALCLLRYCPEWKRQQTMVPQHDSSSLRRTQRRSHKQQLQGIDAPVGINPLEHEELPMSVQQVQQNVKPTLATLSQMSIEKHHDVFSQVTALPLSFSMKSDNMVSLYRARMHNKNVILRVLKETANSNEKEHFLGYASFLSGLGTHPFVPALLGVVSVQQPLMVVVEELEHRDLLGYLWKCRQDSAGFESSCDMTEKRLFIMAGQVASALEYLHSKQYIHGNVGARSILVGRDLTAKLWGLGSAYRRRMQASFPDTVEHMELRKWQAPEMLGRRAISQSSDVWSFGILLYEMVTLGDPPFPQLMATELLQYLQRGKHLKQPSTCSALLYTIIRLCCQWSPQQRISMPELIRKLQVGEKSANGRTVLRVPEPLDIEKYMREAGYGEAYNYAVL